MSSRTGFDPYHHGMHYFLFYLNLANATNARGYGKRKKILTLTLLGSARFMLGSDQFLLASAGFLLYKVPVIVYVP